MGGTEINGECVVHGFICVDSFVKVRTDKRAARSNNGEAIGTSRLIGLSISDNLFFGQKRIFVDASRVTGSLGTVFAVFAAAATASVDNGAKVNVVATEVILQPAGPLLQLR